MTRWELFGRGFVMPGLVTWNAVAAQKGSWPVVLLLGFVISLVWSGSVRGIASACATPADRFSYALGAGFGSVIGMVAGKWLA